MAHATNDFNVVYQELLARLNTFGTKSMTRKGACITELFDEKFLIANPYKCIAFCRKPSLEYLEKEFKFYISGSNLLIDAMDCSKFWEKCSDDDITINSNYGKLLFHDKNSKGNTQFQHAIDCLKNNPQSKKAVMTIYDKENAYISNDNPCTMFLRARIDNQSALHLSVYMRSSDIYFGLPYDVPFFVFVQHALLDSLKETYPLLHMGTYTHIAGSLHKYARNEEALIGAANIINQDYPASYLNFYNKLIDKNLLNLKKQFFSKDLELLKTQGSTNYKMQPIQKKFMESPSPQKNSTPSVLKNPNPFMAKAWEASKKSKCLKKHVGAALTFMNPKGEEMLISAFCGGVNGPSCLTCIRDTEEDKYYGDECPSVHSEMKCITAALKIGFKNFDKAIIYVTHGPCDACLKFCDFVGIKKVVYDLPYKTDYTHWPNIEVVNIARDKADTN